MNADVLLCPVDLATPHEPLLDMAARIAQAFDQVVVLLHVVHLPVGVPPAGALPLGLLDTEAAMDVLDDESSKQLGLLSAVLRAHGVPVSHVVRHGEPVQTILDVAEELDAKHVVLGTHGRKGLERMLLGSVAELVLRRGSFPVTVMHLPGPKAD